MKFYEKKAKAEEQLRNGSHFIKHYEIGGDEVKMVCNNCDHKFWVSVNMAIVEIAKNGKCTCSHCGLRELVAYE